MFVETRYSCGLLLAAALCACSTGGAPSTGIPSDPPPPLRYQTDVKLRPEAVALVGSLADGLSGVDAVVNFDHPELLMVGFPLYVLRWRLAPDGAVWFNVVSSEHRGLYRATPDWFTRSDERDLWSYPGDPTGNDQRISGPCDLDPDNDVIAFVVQQGTGEVAYRCKIGPGLEWYDTRGVVRARDLLRVLAWNANGRMLATNRDGVDGVLAPDGSFRPLLNHVIAGELDIRAARAHGDGFWVAAGDLPAGIAPTEMWRYSLSSDGFATPDGVFAPAPPDFYCGSPDQYIGYPTSEELSAAGELYGIGFGPVLSTWRDVVCHRPLLPGTAEIVYDEALDPRISSPSAPFWTRINTHFSQLVTGP